MKPAIIEFVESLLEKVRLVRRIPSFRFDRSLFIDLIRKHGDEVVEGDEPEIDFAVGPIDGVLGTFEGKENRITIDVLEVVFEILFKNPTLNEQEFRQAFDKEVTRVLAHEGGHWNIEKRVGAWVYIERLALAIVFMFVGWFLLVRLLLVPLYSIAMAGIGAFGLWFGIPVAIATFLIGVELVSRFLLLWHGLSAMLIYKITWGERFARSFERKPFEESAWEDVIVVSDDDRVG